MKVLVDARMMGTHQRGIGRYISELLTHALSIDYGVQWTLIVTPALSEESRRGLSARVITTPVRWYSLAEQWVIPRIIWQEHPDTVHIPHFNVPILLSLGRLFNRGPRLVVTIHDLLLVTSPREHASTLPSLLWAIKYVGFSVTVWLALRAADAIIAVSSSTAGQIEHHLPKRYWNKIHVIPEGPPTLPEPHSEGIARKAYFLTIGSCYPHKNLPWVFEGIGRLWKRGIDVDWVHIGPSEEIGDRFFEIIHTQEQQQFGHRIRVKPIGHQTDGQLADWYKHAIATVFTSLSEGYGLPPVEALWCGGKVISTRVPSLHGVQAPQWQLRYIETLADCVEAMEDAWDDHAYRGGRIRVGLEWRDVATQTLRLY